MVVIEGVEICGELSGVDLADMDCGRGGSNEGTSTWTGDGGRSDMRAGRGERGLGVTMGDSCFRGTRGD